MVGLMVECLLIVVVVIGSSPEGVKVYISNKVNGCFPCYFDPLGGNFEAVVGVKITPRTCTSSCRRETKEEVKQLFGVSQDSNKYHLSV